ncbi:MAG: cyclopropane-fatty-acyl-phospholipid synthase, partial [Rhodobacteraceae bacterium]|nr:cyclopropane-fatty-acyl-phospholipid synthase [Paracoccaceae bacterium]
WVSLTRSGGHERAAMVSYWMNSLQGLPGAVDVIVTMNPPPSLDQDTILDETHFSHPRYDRAALDAQEALPTINGHAGTWYCGAWTGNGFHEDGLASAVTVARAFGVIPPWI